MRRLDGSGRGGPRRVPFAALASLTALAALAALAAAGCAGGPAAPAQAQAPAQGQARVQAQAPETPWLGDARKVAMSVPPKLLMVLTAEIDKAGAASAIAVCRERAPELAKAASAETGWQVRRVSLRQRNPKAVPDAWERAALEDFDRRAAAGESPATLEKAELVQEQGRAVQRYMRALPVQPICAQCHGAAAQLGPGVAERLRELYPEDRGTGYRLGEIRGAMTIRRAQ